MTDLPDQPKTYTRREALPIILGGLAGAGYGIKKILSGEGFTPTGKAHADYDAELLRQEHLQIPDSIWAQIVSQYTDQSLLEYAIGQVEAMYDWNSELAQILGPDGENAILMNDIPNSPIMAWRLNETNISNPTNDGYTLQSVGPNEEGITAAEQEPGKALLVPLTNGVRYSMYVENERLGDAAEMQGSETGYDPFDIMYLNMYGNGVANIRGWKADGANQTFHPTLLANGRVENQAPYPKYQEGVCAGYNGPTIMVAPEAPTTENIEDPNAFPLAYDAILVELQPDARDVLKVAASMSKKDFDVTACPFDNSGELFGDSIPWAKPQTN